jgi:CheY-like chemotaxis protein
MSTPGKDGYLFIKEVREQGNGIPAIALTAFARPLDRSKAMAAGFHSHVGKPLDPVELVFNVGSLVGRGKSKA